MTLLDGVVAVLVVLSALAGYRIGFVARVASWVGLLGGYYLALRILPATLELLDLSSPTGRLALVVGILAGGAAAGLALGLLAGHRLGDVVPPGPARAADRVAGGVAGGLVVLVALWLMAGPMADIPGWPARQTRNSILARGARAVLDAPPDATRTVRHLLGERAFPRVFDAIRPAPDAGAAPVDSGLEAAVEDAVAASTVKVTGEGRGCRRRHEGSGFAAGRDLVVTNAHVVAGADRVEVVRPDGKRLEAAVALFDPVRDLAVLRVHALGLVALTRGDAGAGETGAVFGHPGGQAEVRAAPARISQVVPAVGRDIYDRDTSRRQVYVLAASLRRGDSGGPLVNAAGEVAGVAFAVAPDRPGTAYALTGGELDEALAAHGRRPGTTVGTGPCLG